MHLWFTPQGWVQRAVALVRFHVIKKKKYTMSSHLGFFSSYYSSGSYLAFINTLNFWDLIVIFLLVFWSWTWIASPMMPHYIFLLKKEKGIRRPHGASYPIHWCHYHHTHMQQIHTQTPTHTQNHRRLNLCLCER